jgi:hypothetical protein
MSWAKGLGAALAGTLTGLAESAEAEDKKREEITKLGLAQRIKNIEDAKKLQKSSEKKRQEQDSFVSTFAGKFGFMNEETQKIEPLSEAQALEIYTMTSGDPAKALELITDPKKQISFKGVGKVEEIKPVSELAGFDQTLEAFQQMKPAGGLFGRGRYEAVARELENQTKTLGLPSEIEVPQLRKAIGTGLSIAATKDPSVHAVGQFEWSDATGTKRTAEGFMGTNGDRIMYDPTTGEQIAPPANAQFVKKPTRTEDVKTLSARVLEIDSKLSTPDFGKAATALNAAELGVMNLKTTYDQMTPLALDRTVYSTTAGLIGNTIKKAESEIAGIRFVFGAGSDKVKRDASSTIDQIDNFVSNNIRATEPAMKAKVLQALQVRAAYAYLQSEGDTRPSDADLKRAIEQFSATSPEEFIDKALNNWRIATTSLDNLHAQYLRRPEFKTAQNAINRGGTDADGYRAWMDDRTPEKPSVDLPMLFAYAEDDASKIVVNPKVEMPKPEPSKKTPEGVEVTLKNGTKAIIKDGQVSVPGGTKTISVQQAISAGLLDESSIK